MKEKKAERPKAEEAKDADWAESKSLYRFEGSQGEIPESSTHLENCTGKSRKSNSLEFESAHKADHHDSIEN